MHPNLEVQERAVEYLELMRLASEAASGQEAGPRDGNFVDPPLLLTQAIPSLFTGLELNPVAPGAQRKVPVPDELDLDTPINPNLPNLLRKADYDSFVQPDEDDVYQFYSQRTAAPVQSEAAADRLDAHETEAKSYQASAAEEEYLDPDIIARRKAERRARNKDDPFYIPTEDERSGTSTPLHNILKTNNGEDLDLDSIPIMDLDLETKGALGGEYRGRAEVPGRQQKKKVRKKFEILVDENLGPDEPSAASDSSRPELARPTQKGKKSLLEVDSTGLASLSLEETGNSKLDMERREAEEAEMAKALKEVERLRLEMQRASERIQAKDVPPEGQLVKRKRKKAKREAKSEAEAAPAVEDNQKAEGESEATAVKKKKKKTKKQEDEAEGESKAKKKKRRPVVLDEGAGAAEHAAPGS
ncbi:putative ap-3 complex subunit delta [Diplodia seriata]|uniref:Putative ap-3 complex subunit delta n=1 Tax=Diplodia seriata TaxID=420778 RepID=A0A0G2E5C1_9PEZI|nr:putative ap-3 complex subunit delta [Diplodia seriata]